MSTGPAALEILGLSHSFGERRALDDVSLAVPAGAFTVLLGQNGAGKTTLFNLVTRLYGNRAGRIRIFGSDLAERPRTALAKLGVVFQQRSIDLDLSIMQNLIYHAGLYGMSRRDAARRAEEELVRFGLQERAPAKVRTLSGGQVRRVEIARALLHRPALLLLDEPTAGLDIGARRGILEHVRRLCTEEGVGVLWATHLIDEVSLGDQVVVLHEGKVLARGDGASVCAGAGAQGLGEAFTRLTAARTRAA